LAVHLYFGRERPQIYSDEVLMGVAIDTWELKPFAGYLWYWGGWLPTWANSEWKEALGAWKIPRNEIGRFKNVILMIFCVIAWCLRPPIGMGKG